MAQQLSAHEFGDIVGLPHLEVIRRIRRGDIEASKLGWNYVIDESEIKRVKGSDWYQRRMARQARSVAVNS